MYGETDGARPVPDHGWTSPRARASKQPPNVNADAGQIPTTLTGPSPFPTTNVGSLAR